MTGKVNKAKILEEYNIPEDFHNGEKSETLHTFLNEKKVRLRENEAPVKLYEDDVIYFPLEILNDHHETLELELYAMNPNVNKIDGNATNAWIHHAEKTIKENFMQRNTRSIIVHDLGGQVPAIKELVSVGFTIGSIVRNYSVTFVKNYPGKKAGLMFNLFSGVLGTQGVYVKKESEDILKAIKQFRQARLFV